MYDNNSPLMMHLTDFDKYNTLLSRKLACEKSLASSDKTDIERLIIKDVLIKIENKIAEFDALIEL